MDKTAIASLIKEDGRLFSWASKVSRNLELTAEEKDISKEITAWANEIGVSGRDRDGSFASYIKSVITPELEVSRDALIDMIFNQGQIGEFDEKIYTQLPKNTLKAYDSAKGGNVPKSYLDVKNLKPVLKHSQVEFEVPYADLRKSDSFKTVAQYTTYAEEALKNKLFSDVFNVLDATISGTAVGGSTLTLQVMDTFTTDLYDRMETNDTQLIVTLNKYANQIGRLAGYADYLSNDMKNELNKYGMAKMFNGFAIAGLSGYKKTQDGQPVIPDKKVFAFLGKVGDIDMRGDIRVYETSDNNKEVMNVKVTGFDYSFAITRPDKVHKLTLS